MDTGMTAGAIERVNVTAGWSIVPIFLKPDALSGETASVSGAVAADFAIYLAAALDSLSLPDYRPFVETSRSGAERAQRHAGNEMHAIWWYTAQLQSVVECQRRLHELHMRWANNASIDIPNVVLEASQALGFQLIHSVDRIVSTSEYLAFYGDTDRPEMHGIMRPYLLGKPIRLLLLCGQQENSALQIMKTYARYVMRYHSTKLRIENWIHVTNPDAANYPELLRMFAEAGSAPVVVAQQPRRPTGSSLASAIVPPGERSRSEPARGVD